MSYFINNEQKMLELIFAGRNKSYGAYDIRSAYGETLFKSLFYMIIGLAAIFSASCYVSQAMEQSAYSEKEVSIQDTGIRVIFEPKTDVPKSPDVQKPKFHQPNSSAMSTIIDSNAVQTASADLAVNSPTSDTGDELMAPLTPTVVEKGPVTPTIIIDPEDPLYNPDTNPEFEGGLAALYKFIASRLRYPNEALMHEREGKVYVRFVVDEKGYVGHLNLMNYQGFGMDEEALRVVGMIPKFKKPGTFKGKNVKVYFQVPIRFSLGK